MAQPIRKYADLKTNLDYARAIDRCHPREPLPSLRYADAKTNPGLFRSNAVHHSRPQAKKTPTRKDSVTSIDRYAADRKFSFDAASGAGDNDYCGGTAEKNFASNGDEEREMEQDLFRMINRSMERLIRAETNQTAKSGTKSTSPLSKFKASAKKVAKGMVVVVSRRNGESGSFMRI